MEPLSPLSWNKEASVTPGHWALTATSERRGGRAIQVLKMFLAAEPGGQRADSWS